MVRRHIQGHLQATFSVTKRELTPEGYIRTLGVLSVSGITYWKGRELGLSTDPDSSIPVLLSSQSLFSEKTVESFKGKPLTLGHPPYAVWSENIHKYSVGHIGEDVQRLDGTKLAATITITDPEAVKIVLYGEKNQLSIGFIGDFIEDKGTYNGEQYLFSTVGDLDGNHCAIVEYGKAGPDARIMAKESTDMDKKEVKKLVADAIKENQSESEKSLLDKLEGKLSKTLSTVVTKVLGKENKTDKTAKPSGNTEPLSAEEQQKEIRKLARERVETQLLCTPFFGDDFKPSEASTSDMLKEAAKTLKLSVEGKSDDYIRAQVQMKADARKAAKDSKKNLDKQVNGQTKNASRSKPKDWKEVRAKRLSRVANAWQNPIPSGQ